MLHVNRLFFWLSTFAALCAFLPAVNVMAQTGTLSIKNGVINFGSAGHTATIKVVASVPSLPSTGCTPGELAMVTAATLGQQMYQNSGTGSCVWTQQLNTGSSSGGGITVYSAPSVTLSGTQFIPIGGGGLPSGTETAVDTPSPSAATITNFEAQLSAAPGLGVSLALTWRKNAASQSVTCTISGAVATSCSDTTHSFSVSQGDLLTIQLVTTGVLAGTPNLITAAQFGTTGSNGTVNAGTTDQIPRYPANGTAVSGGPATQDSSGNIVTPGSVATGNGGGVSGQVCMSGSSTGSTCLSVPAAAGTTHTILMPIAKGSPGFVLSTDGATPEQTSWVAQTAGGGGAATGGAFASVPSCTSTAFEYIATDWPGKFLCNGSSVGQWFLDGTGAQTPAANLSWGWINQTSASVSTSAGSIILQGTATASSNIQARFIAVPSTPYSCTTSFAYVSPGVQFGLIGMFVSDGTTAAAKAVILGGLDRNTGLTELNISKWTNFTTNSADYTQLLPIPQTGKRMTVTISDDGTTRKYWYVPTGLNRILYFSGTHTDFLTPTEIGIFVNSNTANKIEIGVFDSFTCVSEIL